MDPFWSPFSLKTPLFSFPLLFLRYDLCVFQRQSCLRKNAEQRAEIDNYFSKYESVHFLRQSLEEQSCIDRSILPNLILLTNLLVRLHMHYRYTNLSGHMGQPESLSPTRVATSSQFAQGFPGVSMKALCPQNSAVPGDTISGYHKQSFYFSFNVS